MRQWYVRHAQVYIAVHPDRRLASHSAADLDKYLQDKGRSAALKDWQFRQIVRALQVLFVEFFKPDWAGGFSWQAYCVEARTLTADHATLAREGDVERPADADRPTSPAANLITGFERDYPAPAQRMSAELRLRNYSIRIEQT